MIDLRQLDQMRRISMDQALPLLATESRIVRLEVNTDEPAQLWIADHGELDPEKHRFLCVVMGRDSVLFPAHGPVGIFADTGGHCFAWAAEIEQTWVEVNEPSFTKPHKRNKMTPELTAVAEMLQNAMGHRMAALEAGIYERVRREVQTPPAQPEKKTDGRKHTPEGPEGAEIPAGSSPPDPVLDEGNGGSGKSGAGKSGAGGKGSKPDAGPDA